MSEWTNSNIGLYRLAVGDVIRHAGKPFIVTRVNECSAIAEALTREQVKAKTRFGKEFSFESPGRPIALACWTDPQIVEERRGQEGANNFLASKAARRQVTNTAAQTKTENDMSLIPRKSRARGGLAAEALADRKATLSKDEKAAAKEAKAKEKAEAKEAKRQAKADAKEAKKAAKAAKKGANGNGKTATVSFKGRAARILKLVADGKTDSEINTMIHDEYPGSSKGIVLKMAKAARKEEKKAEQVAA